MNFIEKIFVLCCRGVAQHGRALDFWAGLIISTSSESRGREFKSHHPDHFSSERLCSFLGVRDSCREHRLFWSDRVQVLFLPDTKVFLFFLDIFFSQKNVFSMKFTSGRRVFHSAVKQDP